MICNYDQYLISLGNGVISKRKKTAPTTYDPYSTGLEITGTAGRTGLVHMVVKCHAAKGY